MPGRARGAICVWVCPCVSGLCRSARKIFMKTCEVCGGPEHPEWKAHVFASNAVVASNASASNKVGVKQRWSREAYNAYQREYMRKRRKVK